MSNRRDESLRSADGISKPDSFEMDAPLPDDFGKKNYWVLWYQLEKDHPIRKIGFLVPKDTPRFFVEDDVVYETEPYYFNDIDIGIN